MEIATTPQYVVNLLAEINNMDAECFRPNQQQREGEEAFDELRPYERKVYALMLFTARELDQIVMDARYSLEIRQDQEVHHRVDQLHLKHDLLAGLMRAVVSDRLPHFCGMSLGVREGWKIVKFARRNGLDMLGEMLS